jgi:hypothetical protein
MPTVPQYDSLTVAPNNPEVRVSTPEFKNFAPAEEADRGKALTAAGNVLARVTGDIMETANKVRAAEAINSLTEHGVALQYAKPSKNEDGTENEGGYTNVVGKGALERKSGMSLSDEYTGRLVAKAADIEKGLGNDAQRQMFRLAAADLTNRFKANITAHESKQFTAYHENVNEGIVKTSRSTILANPLDKDAVDDAIKKSNSAVEAIGKLKGFDDKQIADAQLQENAKSISNAIKLLLTPNEKGDINYDGAEAVYNTYKDRMKGTLYFQEANELLGKAGNAKQALSAADEIWAQYGPKGGYNSAVDIFKMKKEAEKLYADRPVLLKEIKNQLDEKKSGFDASQSEVNASGTNAAMAIFMKTKDPTKVMASPVFNSLPASVQFEMQTHMENYKWVQEGRTLEEKQRRERQIEYDSGADYLTYSDPDNLRNMTRNQVEALLPKLGFNRTNHLVGKWEQLQNKDYLLTSSMDQTQFKDIAAEYGYNPYKSNMSDNEKKKLGDLKAGIDLAIEAEAKRTHQPVSKERKAEIMHDALTNQAKVESGHWYSSNKSKPLVTMSEEDIKNIDKSSIVVPQTDRQKIIDALAEMRKKNPGDNRYEATEDNIKTLFLLNKSPAARKLYEKNNAAK